MNFPSARISLSTSANVCVSGSEVELLRPFARDDLHRAYGDFAYLTEAAIGRALGSPPFDAATSGENLPR